MRLISPVSVQSALSLLPSAQPVQPEILYAEMPTIASGVAAIDAAVNPPLAALAPAVGASVNPMQIIVYVAAWVWLIGAAALCGYALYSAARLRLRVHTAVRLEERVFQSEFIDTPFVLGVLRPRIYLPYRLQADERALVLAHERAHLRRGDQLWKPLGYALLAVYWFQPLCWLAYRLLCQDIERACDERVVRALDKDGRTAYSRALLSCSVPRRRLGADPLAFGERDVKRRIREILRDRRPALWLAAMALVVGGVVAVCFLTDPKTPAAAQQTEQSLQSETAEALPAATQRLSNGLYASVEDYAADYLQTLTPTQTDASGAAHMESLVQLATLPALAPDGTLELWEVSYTLPAAARSNYLLTALRNEAGQYQILRAAVDDGTILPPYAAAENLAAYLHDVYVVYAGLHTGKYLDPVFDTNADGSSCAAFYTTVQHETGTFALYIPTHGWTCEGETLRWRCDALAGTELAVTFFYEPIANLSNGYRSLGLGSELTARGEVYTDTRDSGEGKSVLRWLYPAQNGCYELTLSWPDGADESVVRLLQKMAQSFTVVDESGQPQTDFLLAYPYAGTYELRTELTTIPCPNDEAGCTQSHTQTQLVCLQRETGERTLLDERVDVTYWYMNDMPASNLQPVDQGRVGVIEWHTHEDGYYTGFLDIDFPTLRVKDCFARGDFTLTGPVVSPPQDETQILPNGVYLGMDYATALSLARAYRGSTLYRGREPGDNFTIDGVSYYFTTDEDRVLRLSSIFGTMGGQ